MDRFIVGTVLMMSMWSFDLKSNMDRFIDVTRLDVAYDDFHLKSNMDRFIVYFQFCF